MEQEIEKMEVAVPIAELLEAAKKRTKDLAEQLKAEKAAKKANKGGDRKVRDAKILAQAIVLKSILTEIFAYKKLGKAAKIQSDVIQNIIAICNQSTIGGELDGNDSESSE